MIITLEKCLVPECEGASHKWEFERPTLRELERIQNVTGMDVDAWSDGLSGVLGAGMTAAAISACLTLVDILHRRSGIRVPYEDIDVDLADLDFIFEGEEDQAEEGEGEEAEDGEGKDPAPTPVSLPPEDEAPASASGPAPEAESAPRSWPIPQTSGVSSASP